MIHKSCAMEKGAFSQNVSSHLMLRSVPVAPIFLVILCFSTYLWMFESNRHGIIVNVQTGPTIEQLSQIIQEQRDRIEYLSKNPKVVIRCPDDESKIKYPRKANDELTEIVMDTNDECGNSSIIDAVLIVHTSADHFSRREKFRKTYANYNNTSPYRLKVVFLIGSVLDASLQIKLEIENRDYGDTVVGAFLDTYQNLTLKAVMGFRWLTTTCQDVKLLIKMDDDVFFDVRHFFTSYWKKTSYSNKVKSIHCLVWQNAQVGRTGKWKVEKDLFANASYPFPYCAGFFALITPDLIEPMYNYGKSIDFFWIDDVFLYGMVSAAIKGVNFVQLSGKRKALTESYKTYKKCRETMTSCPMWAALTDGEAEFDHEYTAHFEPYSLLNQAVVGKTQVLNGKQQKLVLSGNVNKDLTIQSVPVRRVPRINSKNEIKVKQNNA